MFKKTEFVYKIGIFLTTKLKNGDLPNISRLYKTIRIVEHELNIDGDPIIIERNGSIIRLIPFSIADL